MQVEKSSFGELLRHRRDQGTGVGNKSKNPRDRGDFRDWDWDLGFIFEIWDSELIFRNSDYLGFGLGFDL